jgi:hypothetical protein
MATASISAQGTKLYRGATAVSSPNTPTGFTDHIPELRDFQGPQGTSPEVDVTSLDSTAREKISGLKDNGSFTANMNWIPNNIQHQGLIADQESRVRRWFRLTFSDGTLAEFIGFVTSTSTTGGVDQNVSMALSVSISGAITWTFAS